MARGRALTVNAISSLVSAISPDVEECAKSFLRAVRKEDRSLQTARAYSVALAQFSLFLQSAGMPTVVIAITREHVEEFVDDLKQRGRAPATRRLYHRALVLPFRWLLEEGEITRSPLERIKPPVVPDQRTEMLTDDQLRLPAGGTETIEMPRPVPVADQILETVFRRGPETEGRATRPPQPVPRRL